MYLKLVLLALSAAMLTACALTENLSQRCSEDTQMLCNNLFGMRDDEQDRRAEAQQEQINALIGDVGFLYIAADMIMVELDNLFMMQANYATQTQINNLTNLLEAREADINELEVRVAELESNDNIVDIIDPCGDHPTKIDEVILRTQSGKLIASFSDNANGQNTRFSIIKVGSYVTTDGTNCHFSVDVNGSVN